ncbi:MAG TPA: nitronate monooxygenase [Actinomycetales bacterium]|nr:nitronate monooxygenase [Actinomycetales bacterium]
MRTWLTERLGLDVPVVSAPMARVAGGRLAGAVSAAGALGMIGVAPAATPDWISEQAELATSLAAGRPFGVGLLAWALDDRPDQLDAAVASGAALVSVSYGDYARCVRPLRDAGILVATQAGTVGEARAAAEAGVDVVVARGGEGGGHGRGDVSTLPLLQLVLDAVDLPVLAAGGVAGARGLAAVLAAGAAGGWVGTAFLTCPEAETSQVARQRLLAADDTATAYGRVFDVGQRLAWPPEYGGRALRNAFFDRWQGHEDELARDDDAYHALVAARASQDLDTAPVYAGEGAALLAGEPTAADVVRSFAAAGDLLRRAAQL